MTKPHQNPYWKCNVQKFPGSWGPQKRKRVAKIFKEFAKEWAEAKLTPAQRDTRYTPPSHRPLYLAKPIRAGKCFRRVENRYEELYPGSDVSELPSEDPSEHGDPPKEAERKVEKCE